MTNPPACREQFEKKVDEWCAAIAANGSLSAIAAAEIKAAWNTRPDSGEVVAGLWIGKSECEKPRYGFSSRPALQKLALGNYSLFIHPTTPSPDLSPITALVGKWRDEVASMSKSSPVRQTAEACASKLEAALTQVGGDDARDAARYRWIRNDKEGFVENAILIDRYGEPEVKIGDALDQAIDAAMRGDGEEKSCPE